MRAVSRCLNSGASVGPDMAAVVLRELGALWVPNLRIWAAQALRKRPSYFCGHLRGQGPFRGLPDIVLNALSVLSLSASGNWTFEPFALQSVL
ncbi:hypothetical protein STEG23_009090 [Scotinomys teguina]